MGGRDALCYAPQRPAMTAAGYSRSSQKCEYPLRASLIGLPSRSSSTTPMPRSTVPICVTFVRALRAPEVVAQIAEQGAEAAATTPDEFAAFITAVFLYWGLCLVIEAGVGSIDRLAAARR